MRACAQLTLLGMLACSDAGTDSSASSAASSIGPSTAPASTAASAAPEPTLAQSAAVGPHGTSSAVVVHTDSPRPTVNEWNAVPDLPDGDGRRFPRCTLKRMREWVRAECGFGLYFTADASIGKSGIDFFHDHGKGVVEIRTRPGQEIRGIVDRAGAGARLYIAWPSDEPAPTVITLRSVSTQSPDLELATPEPIPAMPAGAKPKPPPGDWAKGVPVNSAAAESRPKLCDLRALRGWLRLRCGASGTVPTLRSGEDLGVRNEDFFMTSQSSTLEVTVRLAPGTNRTATVDLDEQSAKLHVQWAAGEPAPSEVSLTRGPPRI